MAAIAAYHAERPLDAILAVDDSGSLLGVISLSDIAQHESGERASVILRQISEREARF